MTMVGIPLSDAERDLRVEQLTARKVQAQAKFARVPSRSVEEANNRRMELSNIDTALADLARITYA